MKKPLSLLALSITAISLAGCGQTPMTDADMAAQYGFSIEEFQEQKEAAARMNMSIEDHLNMGSSDEHKDMDHSNMNHDETESTNEDCDSETTSEAGVCTEPKETEAPDDHAAAAARMGMTVEEHEAAGHTGH
jgi:predicted small lipoprotein YifL